MRVAIVRYPGSNCDIDASLYFENSFYVWHTQENITEQIDLLVIPGGFAFGDRVYNKATERYRISPGEKAVGSKVTKLIIDSRQKGIPILGICNGFQILIHLGLLPGKLIINESEKFESRLEECSWENNQKFHIPIANKYGRYVPSDDSNYHVVVRYSSGKIAGISNRERNVFGIMPHPERVRNDIGLKKQLLKTVMSGKKVDQDQVDSIMSSEHVSYKSTKHFLKNLYTSGEHVIQGPGENAGIIDIGDGYALFTRIESHNHPIFINPFQGAATGVGGILRDIFTMGARPIALFDFLRFGTDEKNQFIEDETINGISYYGNCVGVPVVGGDIKRNSCYNTNPLLNVGCVGIGRKENIVYGNALNQGSIMVYIGAKTGLEGVGGADMASKEFKGQTKDLESSIQTGDPFLEKLLLEVCCELSEMKVLEGMQDMGAGGLLCASLEMVLRGRSRTGKKLGCIIDIDKVPLKENLTNTEILISESQERMLLICNMKNLDTVLTKCQQWDLESSVIGEITEGGRYTVIDNADIVYDKNVEDFGSYVELWQRSPYEKKDIQKSRTDSSKWEVYDNTLGGRTLKGPLQEGSYSILDLHEIGKKLYITWGDSVEKCYQKLKTLNVDGLAVVNCLNFGHPKESIGEFEDVVERMKLECQRYDIPVIGGNVSLYNSTNGISIPGTPIIMMFGIV